MNKKYLLAVAACTLMFAACGDDVTEVTNIQQSGMAVLESGEKLLKQKCDTTNAGEMLFVMDSSEAFICDGESWQTLKGADGKDGEDGEKGSKGDSGEDGNNGTSCTATKNTDGSFDLVCGGEKVGTITNGKDGADGRDGKDGTNGNDGTSCTATKNTDGNFDLVCGGEKVGTITNGKDGQDGTNGNNGTSCTATENTDGSFDLVCGGEKVGTITNGKDGLNGNNGTDGTSCTAQSVTNAAGLEGLEVTCGETVVDTIWNGADGEKGDPGTNGDNGNDGVGCSLEDDGEGEGATTTTIFKAMCGMKPYDPAKSFCSEGELYSCDDKPYDPEKQYCLKVTRDGTDIYSVEDLLTDTRDNQVYKTVKIGDQVWMAENLNYSVNPGEQSWCGGGESETTNEGDCSVYGRLYTWAAAVDKSEDECGYGLECDLSGAKNEKGEVRGVCPEGWHLPDTTEWETLLATVGGQDVAAKMLKSASGWKDDEGSSGNGLDAYGFSAHPAGYKIIGGAYFISAGERANFWSASQLEDDSYNAYYLNLHNNREDADLYIGDKRYGHSVRCLKDN